MLAAPLPGLANALDPPPPDRGAGLAPSFRDMTAAERDHYARAAFSEAARKTAGVILDTAEQRYGLTLTTLTWRLPDSVRPNSAKPDFAKPDTAKPDDAASELPAAVLEHGVVLVGERVGPHLALEPTVTATVSLERLHGGGSLHLRWHLPQPQGDQYGGLRLPAGLPAGILAGLLGGHAVHGAAFIGWTGGSGLSSPLNSAEVYSRAAIEAGVGLTAGPWNVSATLHVSDPARAAATPTAPGNWVAGRVGYSVQF